MADNNDGYGCLLWLMIVVLVVETCDQSGRIRQIKSEAREHHEAICEPEPVNYGLD